MGNDIGKTFSTAAGGALGGVAGFLVGGPPGAFAGAISGASIGDVIVGPPPPLRNYQGHVIPSRTSHPYSSEELHKPPNPYGVSFGKQF